MEARIQANEIILPIGTAITFKMIDQNRDKIELKVIDSEENYKFIALFPQNDVDFQIEINNSKCIHGIGYTLTVNNGFYDYYIGAQEMWTMEALYSKGRKLHFMSLNSEEGQAVVTHTAKEYDLSYSEAANVCSKIEFSFEVEKDVPKAQVLSAQVQQMSDSVQSMNVRPFTLSSNRSLACNSSQLFGSQPSQVSQPAQGFGLAKTLFASQPSQVSQPAQGFGLAKTLFGSQPSQVSQPAQGFGLAKTFPANVESIQKKSKTIEKVEKEVGNKGVVCFGEESNQLYNTYSGFTKDNNLIVKPFVVELRFSK